MTIIIRIAFERRIINPIIIISDDSPTIYFVESELKYALDKDEKTVTSTSAPIQSTPKSNLISEKNLRNTDPPQNSLQIKKIETKHMVQNHLKLYLRMEIHVPNNNIV